MSATAKAVEAVSTDARPIIPRNDTNLWTRTEAVRDRIYGQFAKACGRARIEPLLLKSNPSVFPAWVNFEAWLPQGAAGTTERCVATVTIEPKPYHTHEFELEVSWSVRNKRRAFKRVVPFTDAEVEGLISHLVLRGPKPKLRRFREAPLQLWREKNEVKELGKDILSVVMGICVIGGLVGLAILPIGLALWGGALFCYLLIRKRKFIVRNDGKPRTEPRSLVRVDSWQTVLFNLANEEGMVRERFERILLPGLAAHGKAHLEIIWYWGLDGKQERDQYVLTVGRGIVFCQIYRYGQDLYVGWDGHLNRGQWVEQTVGSGIDKRSGNPVSITRVVPGTQATSEYDLIDLSCLMEWTHAQIVKLLKQLTEEKKIDQEIDFKVQRGERGSVVATGGAEPAGGGVAAKVRKAFQRTA